MDENVDFSTMGELERLDYIANELNKEEPVKCECESNKEYKIRLKQYKRERKELLKKQKVYKSNLSEKFISDIAASIQEVNPTWGLMNKKILEEFIRLTIRAEIKTKGGVEEFKRQSENEEELKEKIIKIFDDNDKAKNLDEMQILKFNAAWEQGRQVGAKPREAVKKVFDKLKG